MSTISNQIEEYLKNLLANSESGILEIKRSDLADTFMCVPSQINYVLSTRFSVNQGYVVESRRGGGGFLRIIRLSMDNEPDLAAMLETAEHRKVTAQAGERLIARLQEEGFISKREGMIINALISERALNEAPDPDSLRNSLLNSVLLMLLRDDFAE